jgi:hypothetical protein
MTEDQKEKELRRKMDERSERALIRKFGPYLTTPSHQSNGIKCKVQVTECDRTPIRVPVRIIK